MKLAEEQKYVIRECLKFRKNITTVGGFAGVGKSTVVSNLATALPDFSVCAFTGKAADVLRRKGISRAATIHSTIYKAYTDEDGEVYFKLNEDDDFEGFIVDEGSMLSRSLLEDIKYFNKPIIIVGDHGQLEPIGDDFNIMKEPDYVLEKIHRNAGEIAHFAEFIRKGFRPGAWEYRAPSHSKIKFVSRSALDSHLLEADQIICAFNKTRVEINRKIRKFLGKPDHPVNGDRVMCLRNNHPEGLFNGMQGTIKELLPKKTMVFATDERDFCVNYDDNTFNQIKYDFDYEGPNPFDYCWVTTCHKSQGDEWNRGIVISQSCSLWNQPRWDYTAASRFKVGIVWVG